MGILILEVNTGYIHPFLWQLKNPRNKHEVYDELNIKDGWYDYMSEKKSEIDVLVRAFVTPVEALWKYVENSGYQPMGWQDTDTKPRVKEAHALLESSNRYLSGLGLQPTVDDVREILQKLQEVADAKVNVRNHRDEWPLQRRLQACGPPLKAYVDYIDPELSDSLPWRNGWKTTVGIKMHEMDIQELLCRMKQINCV